MKTIGILGGMSCESTALYYARLNDRARAALGGLHSADCLIRSLNFADIEALQASGDWDGAGAMLADAARGLEAGGAEILILATNTMHKVAGAIEGAVSIPFLHIADATAAALRAAGCKRPGLMATAYTMEQDFYLSRLRAAGLDPIVPGAADRAETHRIIYDELCRGQIRDDSRAAYEAIAARLADAGGDGLILGCTEVGMLLSPANSPLPVFDTALIHCDVALAAALA
jgi:aspartate racemase